jgi:hypothetical protein
MSSDGTLFKNRRAFFKTLPAQQSLFLHNGAQFLHGENVKEEGVIQQLRKPVDGIGAVGHTSLAGKPGLGMVSARVV